MVSYASARLPSRSMSRIPAARMPSKKRLRSTSVGSTFFAPARSVPRTSFTSAYSSPIARLRSSFSVRARAGDLPPVEIATWIEPDSMIAGTMNSQRCVTSTTFTGILRRRQSRATRALTQRSSVDAMTIEASARSLSSYHFLRNATRPAADHCSISAVNCGDTMVTCAPYFSIVSAFRAQTSPPPTIRTGRASMSR